jgi:phi13 family phage major tail protein
MNEAPKIGLDNVVIAKVLSDSAEGITFGEVIPLKGAVNATVNPNSDVAVDFADNGPFFSASNRGNTELNLEMIDVDVDVLAQLLGQRKVNGITVETPLDQSSDYALGFRVWLAGKDANGNNRYQYFWYAKGKFSVPETGGETKTDSLNFGHISVTAQFVQTQFVPNGQETGTICTHIRTDDPSVPASVKANWFNAPVVQTASDDSELTVTASMNASNHKVTFTGSKESGASFVFAKGSAILGQSILVLDANGAIVDGTLAVGTTASTSPTIVFTPSADAETPASVVVTSGLKDSFGVGATPMTDTSL